jgi:hypothetical protein
MDETTKEGSRLLISFMCALFIAMISFLCITFLEHYKALAYFIIITTAYVVSCIVSIMYQYSVCGFVHIRGIFLSNLIVVRNTVLACILLYIDMFPFFQKFVQPTAQSVALTGDVSALRGIEFLSGIVKNVIPEYVEEPVQNGLVYVYWMFWMTLLPVYFLVGVQGICTIQKESMAEVATPTNTTSASTTTNT